MLALLTAINFFNYIDRSVLFAVQPLLKEEFHRSDTQFGILTFAFFFCYMTAAPIIAVFADRYPRKPIVVGGIALWSAATLLTAVTHDFSTLLFRHTLVGIGEASYAAIAPALIADLFAEERRGRMLAIFYIAIPTGTALGYILGGYLGQLYGWRTPFYVAALPGFLLAAGLLFLPEPQRGANEHLLQTPERATLLGLIHNPAFWTATLGMAMMTFALGGASAWMPTFLNRSRGVSLRAANLFFGGSTALNGIVATLFGGWLGDRLLRRSDSAYYFISGVGMILALPAMCFAIYARGNAMFVGIVIAEFFLFLSTGPLNAALVDSVAAPIRATAIAVNLITIHLLGDAFSPVLMGYISDRRGLQAAFFAPLVTIVISGAILFYGMRFAPSLREQRGPGPIGTQA
jgi:MFS family permease